MGENKTPELDADMQSIRLYQIDWADQKRKLRKTGLLKDYETIARRKKSEYEDVWVGWCVFAVLWIAILLIWFTIVPMNALTFIAGGAITVIGVFVQLRMFIKQEKLTTQYLMRCSKKAGRWLHRAEPCVYISKGRELYQ